MVLVSKSTPGKYRASRLLQIAGWSALVLAVLQFASGRSLWLDEAFMGLNILGRSAVQLFQPLDYHVMAPLGWLQLMKWISQLVPNIDYGLRLVPLLCYLGTILVFVRLSRHHFKGSDCSLHSRVLVLLLLAANGSLLYFSNEAKPYSMDVLLMAIACQLGYLSLRERGLAWYWFGAFGIFALLFANAAVLILAGLGSWLAWQWLPLRHRRWACLAVGSIWLVGVALLWFFFLRQHPSVAPMQEHWAMNGSFLPHTISPAVQLDFAINTFRELGFGVMRFKWASPLVALAILVGGIRQWQRNRVWLLCFFGMPFLLQLGLSWFRLYPMEVRLMLYLAVPLTLLAADGLAAFLGLLRHGFMGLRRLVFGIMLVVLFVSLFFGIGFPIKREELKPVLAAVQQKIVPGEAIYVFHKAVPVVQLYRSHGALPGDLPVRYGQFFSTNTQAYLGDLKAAGKRVWLVMTTDHMHHAAMLMADCDRIGAQRLAQVEQVGARAVLFQFP